MTELSIQLRTTDDETIHLVVAGEIDLAVADGFSDAIKKTLGSSAVRTLVIDMGGVEFLDCRGIHVLIGGLQLAKSLNKGFAVINVDAFIGQVMQSLGVPPLVASAWKPFGKTKSKSLSARAAARVVHASRR